MTKEEALHKLEFMRNAYQKLIDENVDEGMFVGTDVTGTWKADAPLNEAYREHVEALDMAISAMEKQEEDKWIPTSERFPKPDKLVWGCDKHRNVEVCQLHEYITGEDSEWFDINNDWVHLKDGIIAWRPYLVPEPYVPEEEVKDGWHPVSEDPPKKESHYWVQLCDSNGKYAWMHECIWTDSGRIDVHTKTDWHWIGIPQFTKIVAWRKLPDIYTEEEQ